MAIPDLVMFIRHGEKPGDNGTPHGINHQGEHDSHSLAVRGWTRSGALAALFAQPPANSTLVTPARILATKSTDDYKSKREVDTATALARRLGLTVDDSFDHRQIKELTRSILGDPRSTLVVWHHGSLSSVVAQFPMVNGDDVPRVWPEERFDLIWILHREPDSGRYQFASVGQDLLDGDLSTDASPVGK